MSDPIYYGAPSQPSFSIERPIWTKEGFRAVFGLTLLAIVGTVLVVVSISGILPQGALIPVSLGVQFALLFGAVVVGMRVSNVTWRDMGMIATEPRWYWIAVGIMIPLLFVRLIVAGLVFLLIPLDEEMAAVMTEAIAPQGGPLPLIIAVILVSVVAPLVEEFIFRGVFHKGLRERGMSFARAGFFSSALFGIYHLNAPQGIAAFILGYAAAWLYERSNSLWPAIILHAVNNFFAQGLVLLLLAFDLAPTV